MTGPRLINGGSIERLSGFVGSDVKPGVSLHSGDSGGAVIEVSLPTKGGDSSGTMKSKFDFDNQRFSTISREILCFLSVSDTEAAGMLLLEPVKFSLMLKFRKRLRTIKDCCFSTIHPSRSIRPRACSRTKPSHLHSYTWNQPR